MIYPLKWWCSIVMLVYQRYLIWTGVTKMFGRFLVSNVWFYNVFLLPEIVGTETMCGRSLPFNHFYNPQKKRHPSNVIFQVDILLTHLSWIRASCFIWLTFPQFVRETSREVSTQLGGNSCWFPLNAPSSRTARTAMLGGVIVFLAFLTQLDREKISQTSLFVIYQLHISANTKLRMSEVVATWLFGSPWFQWTVWKKGAEASESPGHDGAKMAQKKAIKE